MKYYLSGLEDSNLINEILKVLPQLNFILFSFMKLQSDKFFPLYKLVEDHSTNILIDSGAFTLQKKKAESNYYQYTKRYVNFIEENDNPKIEGYFEMDIDNIIGYDNVVELRKMLEEVSDKIIPVWHSNRGIREFKQLCEDYDYVAITGKSADIRKNQYKLFVDYAHKHNTRIHGLGISDKTRCLNIPFDSVDSTNYLNGVKYAKHKNKRMASDYVRNNYKKIRLLHFIQEHNLSSQYYEYWKKRGFE